MKMQRMKANMSITIIITLHLVSITTILTTVAQLLAVSSESEGSNASNAQVHTSGLSGQLEQSRQQVRVPVAAYVAGSFKVSGVQEALTRTPRFSGPNNSEAIPPHYTLDPQTQPVRLSTLPENKGLKPKPGANEARSHLGISLCRGAMYLTKGKLFWGELGPFLDCDRCPCHGSQYDENGSVLKGPAPHVEV